MNKLFPIVAVLAIVSLSGCVTSANSTDLAPYGTMHRTDQTAQSKEGQPAINYYDRETRMAAMQIAPYRINITNAVESGRVIQMIMVTFLCGCHQPIVVSAAGNTTLHDALVAATDIASTIVAGIAAVEAAEEIGEGLEGPESIDNSKVVANGGSGGDAATSSTSYADGGSAYAEGGDASSASSSSSASNASNVNNIDVDSSSASSSSAAAAAQ